MMSRFSMILLAVLMLGGATVLAITAAVDFAEGYPAAGRLAAHQPGRVATKLGIKLPNGAGC
jgi:hypothetical protein